MFRGEKVTLRALEPGDADAMYFCESEASKWEITSIAAPISKYALRKYAEEYDADPIRAGQIRLTIETRESEVSGFVDLFNIDPINRTAEVGIVIFSKFQRRGFATEALSLIERYAMLWLRLRTLSAKITCTNTESIGLFEKCGYAKAGTLKNWIATRNNFSDLYIYQKMLDN
ncbi:MAG: GNAT family N-acetyltransferase [Muribaculaceae bacterium]|nr:GNAT family N-acetyltransferase [Muribaculaceae bacterium]